MGGRTRRLRNQARRAAAKGVTEAAPVLKIKKKKSTAKKDPKAVKKVKDA